MEAKTVKSNMTDMTQGSPAGLILFFALPLLVGNMFQQLYNMVDSIVVGRFVGSTALAAVGTAFPDRRNNSASSKKTGWRGCASGKQRP